MSLTLTYPLCAVQYCSKVSWQSLVPWSSRLNSQLSKLSRIKSRVLRIDSLVSRIESRGKNYNELVAWLISRNSFMILQWVDWFESVWLECLTKEATCTCTVGWTSTMDLGCSLSNTQDLKNTASSMLISKLPAKYMEL